MVSSYDWLQIETSQEPKWDCNVELNVGIHDKIGSTLKLFSTATRSETGSFRSRTFEADGRLRKSLALNMREVQKSIPDFRILVVALAVHDGGTVERFVRHEGQVHVMVLKTPFKHDESVFSKIPPLEPEPKDSPDQILFSMLQSSEHPYQASGTNPWEGWFYKVSCQGSKGKKPEGAHLLTVEAIDSSVLLRHNKLHGCVDIGQQVEKSPAYQADLESPEEISHKLSKELHEEEEDDYEPDIGGLIKSPTPPLDEEDDEDREEDFEFSEAGSLDSDEAAPKKRTRRHMRENEDQGPSGTLLPFGDLSRSLKQMFRRQNIMEDNLKKMWAFMSQMRSEIECQDRAISIITQLTYKVDHFEQLTYQLHMGLVNAIRRFKELFTLTDLGAKIVAEQPGVPLTEEEQQIKHALDALKEDHIHAILTRNEERHWRVRNLSAQGRKARAELERREEMGESDDEGKAVIEVAEGVKIALSSAREEVPYEEIKRRREALVKKHKLPVPFQAYKAGLPAALQELNPRHQYGLLASN